MQRRRPFYQLAVVLLTAFLTACGGGGGGGDDASDGATGAVSTSVVSGVAVDPYIVGAIVEEISANGKVVQVSEGSTNAKGEFTFSDPVGDGSTIRLKVSARGMHGNAPYEGMLKRKISVEDDDRVVLSPLTTLIANGMSVNEVIGMMADAGLPGLTEADVYADPVAGLEDLTNGVNDGMFRNLQAAMAVNGFMAAIGNYNYSGQLQPGANLRMGDMVAAVTDEGKPRERITHRRHWRRTSRTHSRQTAGSS